MALVFVQLAVWQNRVTNIPFAKTYHDGHEGSRYQALGATILWKFVPDTVREWYILLIEGK